MFEFIPPPVLIFLISMVPLVELRGAIPIALGVYNLPLWQVFPLAIIGNILPVPFILIFFGYVEILLRKSPRWNCALTTLFDRTRRRASKKIKRYEALGLLAFVAIPLPFTGAWTGALIAYLFGLKFSRSLLIIFLGVVIAGIIVVALCLTGREVWMLK